MVLTPSNPFPIGNIAPDFTLPDTLSGEDISLADIRWEKATVVMFICNHCPFVMHVNDELVRLAKDYTDKWISFVAISSNDVETHPDDSPEMMQQIGQDVWYSFPYLYDETQQIAKAYDAACTPDFYVFDNELKSVYHGQLDDSRPGNGIDVTGESIRNVLESLIQEKPYTWEQKPSIGCNIKWK